MNKKAKNVIRNRMMLKCGMLHVFVTVGVYVLTPCKLIAQPREVATRVHDLHIALITKDIENLNVLLHDSLCYGHSNGWEETKQELKSNLQNGKLSYLKIEEEPVQTRYTGKQCLARYKAAYNVVLEGKEISLQLWVAQTWIYEKRKWKLLMRQSTKMP
ncbi:MAG: nuclear transport factor 2 family protein [Bacteroidetes bacterium]|nr:nuclear transport factor 2 family protein [Bacteroidota bacterium]